MCPFVWFLDLVIPSILWLQNLSVCGRLEMFVPVDRHFFLLFVRVDEVRNYVFPTHISFNMALSVGLSAFIPRAFMNSSLDALCFNPAETMMVIGRSLVWSERVFEPLYEDGCLNSSI